MTKAMKKILFALLLALPMLQAAAQRPLPPSLHKYTQSWSYPVINMMRKAGFDLKAASTNPAPAKAESRSNDWQLDSTNTFFGYTLSAGGDSSPVNRSTYTYPQPGTQEETNFQFDNGVWITLNRVTYSKDNLDRIVNTYAEAYDPVKGDFVPDSRLEAYPHGNSQILLDSFNVYSWDSLASNWTLLIASQNQYDAQDRLIQSVSTFDYFGQPLLFKDVYSYNAAGDNHLIQSFAVFNGAEIPSSKNELLYSNHLLIQTIQFASDQLGGYIQQVRSTFAYTASKQLMQENTYEWNAAVGDWAPTQFDKYEYDNENRVSVKETIHIEQDGSESRERFSFAYLEGELIAKEDSYIWDGTDYYLSDRKYYHYSKDGQAASPEVETLRLRITPNPTTGLINIELPENAGLHLFDAQGREMGIFLQREGNQLNVSALPAGWYLISADSADSRFVGKFLKQ